QADASVQAHFQQRGSDVLYELRLLNQEQRVKAASLALQHRLDLDEAKALAKAYQEFARVRKQPEGFEDQAGDAFAYHFWRLARGRSDLQDRSRLIAKGLRFAVSETARKKLEELLTDFTVVVSRAAPTMPLYRLEDETDLPRLVPLLGRLPVPVATVAQAAAARTIDHPFPVVELHEGGTWLPLPGWQSIVAAQDPVAVETQSDALPNPPAGKPELVIVVIDRGSTDWDGESYYGVDRSGQLELAWFGETPTEPLVGRVVVVLRAPRILDEDAITIPWQLEE
ncbi:MAG: RuBisCO accumulation factor 1, partial [Prochlorothrix sp.]